MANNDDVDYWVSKFGGPAPTQQHAQMPTTSYEDPRAAFIGQGKEIFPKDTTTVSDRIRGFKDVAHQVGMGMFAAPVNAAAGAIGLVSPGAADAIQNKVQDVRNFQSQNDIGGPSQLSPGTSNLAFNAGQALTSTAIPTNAASVTGGALAGAIGGLASRETGDTRTDNLSRIGLGAAAGAAAGGLMKLIPGLATNATNKVQSVMGSNAPKVAPEIDQKAVTTLNTVFQNEIKPAYKQLGVPINKMTDAEKAANAQFIDEFKTQYTNAVNRQYGAALDYVKAPDDVVKFFGNQNKEVMDAARAYLEKSDDIGAKAALSQPGSMRYYEELRQALKNMPGAGNGNLRVAGEAADVMAQNSPEYMAARDAYRTGSSFAKNLGNNFYNSIKTDSTAKTFSLTQELLKTESGKDFVNKTFLDGMRSQLIANSNLDPLQQLQKTLGRNPNEVTNTITFLKKIGQDEIADKFSALSSFATVASKIGPKDQSISAKIISKNLNDIDSNALGDAVIKLMGSNKWSEQFNKIMQEQGDHLVRTEKLSNLIKRVVGTVVRKIPGGGEVIDTSKYVAGNISKALPTTTGAKVSSLIQQDNGDNY